MNAYLLVGGGESSANFYRFIARQGDAPAERIFKAVEPEFFEVFGCLLGMFITHCVEACAVSARSEFNHCHCRLYCPLPLRLALRRPPRTVLFALRQLALREHLPQIHLPLRRSLPQIVVLLR